MTVRQNSVSAWYLYLTEPELPSNHFIHLINILKIYSQSKIFNSFIIGNLTLHPEISFGNICSDNALYIKLQPCTHLLSPKNSQVFKLEFHQCQ